MSPEDNIAKNKQSDISNSPLQFTPGQSPTDNKVSVGHEQEIPLRRSIIRKFVSKVNINRKKGNIKKKKEMKHKMMVGNILI